MSETQTASLTDFLLQRIAEDEADAGHETWGQPIPGDCWGPDRVLAECEAKREMVEVLAIADAMDGEPERIGTADHLLRILALPHADHPDYREEWSL